MSLYLDLKYINMLSGTLALFKRKGPFLVNFRCNICGDSELKKRKARGYFYKVPNKNDMSMKCHNCGASMYFSKYLQTYYPNFYGDYILEKFKNEKNPSTLNDLPQGVFTVNEKRFNKKPDETLLDKILPRLDTLPDDNEAVQFCLKRKIPRDKFNRLYFIDDIKNIVQLAPSYRERIQGAEPRLVLPYYNAAKKLEAVSCRGLRGEALRYVTVKIDPDATLVFGLEFVDTSKKIYATEGPIDSLFLPNGIAVGGTSFGKLERVGMPKENIVVVLDNQPRNKEVCNQYNRYIKSGYKICIWPQAQEEKDVNDMILAGADEAKVKQIIDKNTFKGLEADLKFTAWRRC